MLLSELKQGEFYAVRHGKTHDRMSFTGEIKWTGSSSERSGYAIMRKNGRTRPVRADEIVCSAQELSERRKALKPLTQQLEILKERLDVQGSCQVKSHLQAAEVHLLMDGEAAGWLIETLRLAEIARTSPPTEESSALDELLSD